MIPSSPSNDRRSLIQIHLAIVLAAGASLIAKILPISPVVITCGRTVFGSLALALVARFTGSSLRLHNQKDLLMIVLSGGLLAVHWMTFIWSVQVSTVAVALLAFSSFPLFVTFLEPIIFGERLHYYDLLTALIVVAGLTLVSPNLDTSNHLTQGVLWSVFSAFAYALLSLQGRVFVRTYPAITVAFYQQAFAALCTLPFAIQWEGTLTTRDLFFLLLFGTVFTALVQALIVASLRRLRVQTVSIVCSLEPVYGILFAWLLLHETPSIRTLLGGLLIGGAVLWDSLKHHHSPAPTL